MEIINQSSKEFFLEICNKYIKRDGIFELLDYLEHSDFFTAPASTRFHSNYEGGLCSHSLKTFDILKKLNEEFSCGYSNETIAIVGLFHDLCKIGLYKKEIRNVKEDNEWKQKEVYVHDEILPLGHGEKSCIILSRFLELSFDECLAIRWHMGGFDCSVKGGDYSMNTATNKSALVTLLQCADMIASNVFQK